MLSFLRKIAASWFKGEGRILNHESLFHQTPRISKTSYDSRLALIESWNWWKITNTSTLVGFWTNHIGHWSFFFGNWCSSRIKLSSTWIDVKVVFRHDIRQVSENALGVPGVPWHTQILAERCTPGFSDLPTALMMRVYFLQSLGNCQVHICQDQRCQIVKNL